MKKMRGYNCFFTDNPDFDTISNKICWGDIKYNNGCKQEKEIYISDFTYDATKKYVKTLVDVINKITPCELVIQNDVQYIKFKLLKNYDSSLILLSFIRTLWYNPIPVKYLEEVTEENKLSYIETFFNSLKELQNKIEDSMELLLTAHKKALEPIKIPNNYNDIHSNVYASERIQIKSTKDLLNYKGMTTEGFICGK